MMENKQSYMRITIGPGKKKKETLAQLEPYNGIYLHLMVMGSVH